MTAKNLVRNIDDEYYNEAFRKTQDMMNEQASENNVVEKYYVLLHWQIASQLPRGHTNIHPYSTGRTYANMTTECKGNVWSIKISPNVPYARYMLGYDDSGYHYDGYTERQQRNAAIVPSSIKSISKIIASQYGGSVIWK